MNINNIQLPPQLISELYRSSLIDHEDNTTRIAESEHVSQKSGTVQWNILGNNARNVLVVVNEPGNKVLPAKQLAFLVSMLNACKLGMDDITVINRSAYPEINYQQIVDHFKSRIVLLFDMEPSEFGLPMSFPHYQLQAFANATFLFTPSLSELESDKLQKSKLWVCLKRLFNL